MPNVKIIGMRHAALSTQNLERALEFFCTQLGFSPYHTRDKDWAMLHKGPTTLSLVKLPEGAEPAKLGATGKHPPHLGILVSSKTDVDVMHEKLKALGLPQIGHPVCHRDESYGFYFKDWDHNILELLYIPMLPVLSIAEPESLKFPRAAILLAHGSKDQEWCQPIEEIQRICERNEPSVLWKCAYLENQKPTLAEQVEILMNSPKPPRKIDVIPAFLSAGGHVSRDIPLLLNEIRSLHPGLQINLHAALGMHWSVQESLAYEALAALRSPE